MDLNVDTTTRQISDNVLERANTDTAETEAINQLEKQEINPTAEDELSESELDEVDGGVSYTPKAPAPIPIPYPNVGTSSMIKG